MMKSIAVVFALAAWVTVDVVHCTSASQGEAAVLLGGDGLEDLPDIQAVSQVESWPCELNIPKIPEGVDLWARASVLGNRIFLCGGGNDETKSPCHILENGAWHSGPNMLNRRRSFTLNTVGNTLVAAGDLWNSYSVEILRLNSTAWEPAGWELTSARSHHCAVTYSDSELILVGGRHGNNNELDGINLIEKYNINTGEVTVLPDLVEIIDTPTCAIWGNSLVVSGGFIAGSTADTVRMLDFSSLTWSSLPSLHKDRIYHTMGVVNGALTVFGGRGQNQPEDSIEVLNGTQWLNGIGKLKIPRFRHPMVILPCAKLQIP